MKQTVLLTGATGFIGSHVADRLLRDGSFQVITIAREPNNGEKIKSLQDRGIEVVEGSFLDERLLDEVFHDHLITHVIHLAAIRGEGTHTKKDYYDVNVRGTERLLEASHRHTAQRFIYCSSVGVLGIPPSLLPAGSQTALRGDTDYQKSKIYAEGLVEAFIEKGLDVYIVRPTITYGKGDRGFPSTFVRLVRRGLLPLSTRRNLIHLLDVDFLAEVFLKLLTVKDVKQRVFVVADKDPISVSELADLINSYYHGKPYDSFLKIPGILCDTLLSVFQAIGSNKWSARGQLLFKDWYYKTEGLGTLGIMELTDTREKFVRFLEQAV